MGKWWNNILKGGIDIGETANNLLNKLDDSSFTTQENATYQKDLADATVDFYKLTLSENTTRSKTRRKIAIMIIKNYLIVFWAFIILWIINVLFNPIFKLSELLEIIKTFKIVTAFLMILAFFFGGYYAQKFKKDPG